MLFAGKIRQVADGVVRLGDELASVDMVRTSRGWVRVGAMPEIAKLARATRIASHYVVVRPGRLTEVGDGVTGEEFICWSSINAAMFAGEYLGSPADLQILRQYLEPAVPYFFDEEQLHIVRRDWLETLYYPQPLDEGGVRRFGAVEIRVTGELVEIREGSTRLYRGGCSDPAEVARRVDEALARIPRDEKPADRLELLVVGSGNGHATNASSFLLRYADRRVWLDPSARPHETLGAVGVHWDDVTDVVISHIHEDHWGGLTACLARARRLHRKIRLYATRESLAALQLRLGDRVPDWAALVDFHAVAPGQRVRIGEADWEFRLNHHILPSGTLGLKVRLDGRCLGISGDTKYDEAILARLGRSELTAEWFADCHLVFHEVELARPWAVHSFFPEVEKLAQKIPGRLVVYHTAGNTKPLEMAQDGRWYPV
jgi:ribonuclease BN (tRNA processing enzyme)